MKRRKCAAIRFINSISKKILSLSTHCYLAPLFLQMRGTRIFFLQVFNQNSLFYCFWPEIVIESPAESFPFILKNLCTIFCCRLRHDRQLESASVKARLQSYEEIRRQNELLNNANLNLQMTLEDVRSENQALSLALTEQVRIVHKCCDVTRCL